MQTVIVGFYSITAPDGTVSQDSVETPVIGKPAPQYAALDKLIAAKHPDAVRRFRISSAIEQRDAATPGFLEVLPGQTLRSLFDGATGPVRNTVCIGKVFFNSAPYEIFLNYLASRGFVQMELKSRMKGTGNVKFSNRFDAQLDMKSVPGVIKTALGNEVKGLDLKFKLP